MNTENPVQLAITYNTPNPRILALPKISKHQLQPNSIFKKLIKNKYQDNNIFKKDNLKKPNNKINIKDQIRQLRDKQNDQLEYKMKEMIRKHQLQMRQIQQKSKNVDKQIANYKHQQYNIKLTLWQIKNEIFNLKDILAHQEEQCERLQRMIDEEQQEEQEEDDVNYEQNQAFKQQQNYNNAQQQQSVVRKIQNVLESINKDRQVFQIE